jgi:uncharacterized membrane protein
VRRRVALIALAAALLGWNAALFAAPQAAYPRVAAFTYLSGALVCHQKPERSFHRGAAQYPVCARCLGLYAGAAIGMIAWVMIAGLGGTSRPRAARWLKTRVVRITLTAVALPTVVTWALASVHVWDASNAMRFVLALPLGATIAAVIAAVAAGDLR